MNTYMKKEKHIGLFEISATLDEISTVLGLITNDLEDELNGLGKSLKIQDSLAHAKTIILGYNLLCKNLVDLNERVTALEEAPSEVKAEACEIY